MATWIPHKVIGYNIDMKNSEIQNSNTEAKENNDWDELNDKKMNLALEKNLDQKDKLTAKEKQDDLLETTNRVRQAYQEKNRNESSSLSEKTLEVDPGVTNLKFNSEDLKHEHKTAESLDKTRQPETADQKFSLPWSKKISESYEKHERPRIDKIKANLPDYRVMNEARRKQISTRPGFLKQTARLVMDKNKGE